MLPLILETFVDIPLSTSQSLSVRSQLDHTPLSGDGIALAKQLLHLCEQRGPEWVTPFRKALAKARLMLSAFFPCSNPQYACILRCHRSANLSD